jgi:hypothetical protein
LLDLVTGALWSCERRRRGCVRLCVGVVGCVWLCVVVCGCVWLCVVVCAEEVFMSMLRASVSPLLHSITYRKLCVLDR